VSDILTETLKTIRIHGAPIASVFLTRDGTPYRDISTAFATAVRRAKISDVTFHNLRHGFASRLVMGGVDLTTVKELMGHEHIAMTLRYAHLAPGHKRVAIAVLDQHQEKVPAIFTTDKVETSRPTLQPIAR
jgi:site-specific recombinase XerD